MEFADLEKRPQKAREQPTWESLQSDDPEQEAVIPGYGGDYGKNVPGLRMFSAYELATSAQRQAEGETKAGASENTPKDVGGTKDTRIAQSFAGENGVQWDPVSELFKVIVGGAIVGAKATWDAANDLYRQVMRSQNGDVKKQQIFKSQHGRGNQGDSGILNEADELVRQGKATNRADALEKLRREAKQANNGKGDQKKLDRIKATEKSIAARPSRETKDKKKKKQK
jgi:Bacterial toxin 34